MVCGFLNAPSSAPNLIIFFTFIVLLIAYKSCPYKQKENKYGYKYVNQPIEQFIDSPIKLVVSG